MAESGPRARLQVLQNSGSRMFMFRVKTMSSRSPLTKSKKKKSYRERSNIKSAWVEWHLAQVRHSRRSCAIADGSCRCSLLHVPPARLCPWWIVVVHPGSEATLCIGQILTHRLAVYAVILRTPPRTKRSALLLIIAGPCWHSLFCLTAGSCGCRQRWCPCLGVQEPVSLPTLKCR